MEGSFLGRVFRALRSGCVHAGKKATGCRQSPPHLSLHSVCRAASAEACEAKTADVQLREERKSC